ncbi:MAG: response regulator [Bdellovibrionaceae bacterium]|jgi:DNA-binding response OmpR family regulator|nr:response regulator [Pseudobdellovibrionaceae bacterium]
MKNTHSNILIVEDNYDLAISLKDELSVVGYSSVNVCHCGDSAVNYSMENETDLVIMDINLPGNRDGIESAVEIQKKKNIPIIYVTGFLDKQILHRAKDTKNSSFTVKPFNIDELKANIELTLSAHKNRIKKLVNTVSTVGENDVLLFLKRFGGKLKDSRKSMELTQLDASGSLGMNYRHYQDIEGGKVNLKLETLVKLVKFYNIECEII